MLITRAGLWLAVGGLAAAMAWSAWLGLRRRTTDGPGEEGAGLGAVAGAAALLTILGGKLWAIDRFAPASPYWDQWFEALGLYRSWHEKDLPWWVLGQPAGAHRIVFTRLSALALFDLNQQWDNRLQAVVQAFLHAAAVAWALAVATRGRPPWEKAACWVAAVVLTALPFARENVVWGYQSQFYFLIAFTLLAARLLTTSAGVGPRLWLGLGATTAAVFSLGSGPLCAVALMLAFWIEVHCQPRRLGALLAAITGCAAIAALGFVLRYQGENLEVARTLGDFLTTTGRSLAYPFIGDVRLAPLMWLPFAAWLLRRLWRREPASPGQRFVLVVGLFALLHGPAVGLARGGGGPPPSTRYFDLLSLGVLANLVALLDLTRGAPGAGRRRWPGLAAAVAWCALATLGFVRLHPRLERPIKIDRAMARYLRTLEPTAFADPRSTPYPNAHDILSIMADPYVRSIMPARIRAPLLLEAEDPGSSAFEARPDPACEAVGPAMPVISSRWKHETLRSGPFRSREVPRNGLPWLRFWVTGDFEPGGTQELAVVSPGGTVEVRPGRQPGNGWVAVTVRRPGVPFRIVAQDGRLNGWFGFTPPIEIGRLSLLSEQLLSMWGLELGAGLLLAGVVATGALATLRRTRRTGNPT